MTRGARKKVVVLGGGVAGMSAAHELVQRGFDVEVFERKALPGGKARSLPASGPSFGPSPFVPLASQRPAPARSSRPPLPGEHGFRFFPGFYKHVVDTMQNIPYRGGAVADNLVVTTEAKIAGFDRPSYVLPAQFPRGPGDIAIDLSTLVAVFSGVAGVPPQDAAFFATKLWKFVTSCSERRLAEYEKINWWDFIEADAHSAAYKKYFGNGITRSLVAAKARRASTKTIGDIFVQIACGVLLPGEPADRVLNGPTNDVWINPWLAHLKERGVVYHLDAEVRALRTEQGVIKSAVVARGNQLREVTADFFLGALPVERMAGLVNPELLKLDASLANLNELTDYVEWMNGIQYFLKEDVPITHGHTIYIDSPWALTSVSQAQFWREFDLSRYGDGTVRGILSVDISDWDVPGLNGKAAQNCSRREIALETWEQLKKSLNTSGEILSDRHLHSWFLDPDIEDQDADGDPATPRIDTNAEPLLVNYVDTWRIRPEAVTRIPNFFLASDYVRTFTDLATMEAANEAARRAVNGILRAAASDAEPCKLWDLHEPEVFLPLRAYDRVRYRRGLAWDANTMNIARHVTGLSQAAPAEDDVPAGSVTPRATHDAEVTAADARASSELGLRRLRISPA